MSKLKQHFSIEVFPYLCSTHLSIAAPRLHGHQDRVLLDHQRLLLRVPVLLRPVVVHLVQVGDEDAVVGLGLVLAEDLLGLGDWLDVLGVSTDRPDHAHLGKSGSGREGDAAIARHKRLPTAIAEGRDKCSGCDAHNCAALRRCCSAAGAGEHPGPKLGRIPAFFQIDSEKKGHLTMELSVSISYWYFKWI